MGGYGSSTCLEQCLPIKMLPRKPWSHTVMSLRWSSVLSHVDMASSSIRRIDLKSQSSYLLMPLLIAHEHIETSPSGLLRCRTLVGIVRFGLRQVQIHHAVSRLLGLGNSMLAISESVNRLKKASGLEQPMHYGFAYNDE